MACDWKRASGRDRLGHLTRVSRPAPSRSHGNSAITNHTCGRFFSGNLFASATSGGDCVISPRSPEGRLGQEKNPHAAGLGEPEGPRAPFFCSALQVTPGDSRTGCLLPRCGLMAQTGILTRGRHHDWQTPCCVCHQPEGPGVIRGHQGEAIQSIRSRLSATFPHSKGHGASQGSKVDQCSC